MCLTRRTEFLLQNANWLSGDGVIGVVRVAERGARGGVVRVKRVDRGYQSLGHLNWSKRSVTLTSNAVSNGYRN